MRAALHWGNAESAKLCREVLHEVSGAQAELLVSPAGLQSPDVDIYIWDYAPGEHLPSWVMSANLQQHLFLVNRNDLEAFRAIAPSGAANVLLKPVGRPTLIAFLRQAAVKGAARHIGTLQADRDEVLQCVIQANLKLQEYDQERTNFLARAVHDFRAPLTAISGYCSLLTSGKIGELSNQQRDALGRMQSSSQRLSGLLESLMDLSVGWRHELRPDFQDGDIQECADQAVRELTSALEQKDISVSFDFAPSSRPLHFDLVKIQQVLLNLLENACRFTPRQGSIEIQGLPYFWDRRLVPERRSTGAERRRSSHPLPNAYRVDIHDCGPRIPSQYLRTVFEEYTSYFGGTDRSGGGLSLAICRSIIESHGGRIWAENVRTGSTLSFVLPYGHDNGCNVCRPQGKERVF